MMDVPPASTVPDPCMEPSKTEFRYHVRLQRGVGIRPGPLTLTSPLRWLKLIPLPTAFLTRKQIQVESAQRSLGRPNYQTLPSANGAALSFSLTQHLKLFDLFYIAHPFHIDSFLSGDTNSAGNRNSQINFWDLLDPGKQDLSYQSDLLLRGYHTTNETMPTSVPKTSALGVCKQCQTNDAVENVRSRPMCR